MKERITFQFDLTQHFLIPTEDGKSFDYNRIGFWCLVARAYKIKEGVYDLFEDIIKAGNAAFLGHLLLQSDPYLLHELTGDKLAEMHQQLISAAKTATEWRPITNIPITLKVKTN